MRYCQYQGTRKLTHSFTARTWGHILQLFTVIVDDVRGVVERNAALRNEETGAIFITESVLVPITLEVTSMGPRQAARLLKAKLQGCVKLNAFRTYFEAPSSILISATTCYSRQFPSEGKQ